LFSERGHQEYRLSSSTQVIQLIRQITFQVLVILVIFWIIVFLSLDTAIPKTF